MEAIDNVVFAAAYQQLFAIGREAEAVKGLRQRLTRYDFRRLEIDHRDNVRPVAGMEHGGELALRMDRDIDREVAQFDLPAGRPQRPLVRQQDRSVGPHARQEPRGQRLIGRRDRRNGGRDNKRNRTENAAIHHGGFPQHTANNFASQYNRGRAGGVAFRSAKVALFRGAKGDPSITAAGMEMWPSFASFL